jgi:hypothetical protein
MLLRTWHLLLRVFPGLARYNRAWFLALLDRWFFATRKRQRFSAAVILLALLLMAQSLFGLFGDDTPQPAPQSLPAVPDAPKPVQNATGAKTTTDEVILSLFDPGVNELAGIAREDSLRARYRTQYIGIYLLKECGIDVTRYHTKLARRFSSDAAGLSAAHATNMLVSIIEDARSSYIMLYQNTPCERRNLAAFERYFSSL